MAGGKDPELRIGLVLYGGVSLAVYIYGVVIEVQRLLAASAELEGAAGVGTAAKSVGYATALREAGLSRASVDIIAGTSAGGINGILLAKALAAGTDVGVVRDLWIEKGDIGGLLRRVDDPDADSLLSTEVMEKQLLEGFGDLGKGNGPTMGGALDLFVSATHLRGDGRQFRDSLGATIDTLKHRYVFQLKLRPSYHRDDFAPRLLPGGNSDPNSHLVKLSRATSAFPVAFEPVRIDPVDNLLGPQDEPSAWFADGGILNNKPFTEALKTIFTRSSDRPVRRWLLSVDPDPKPLERPPAPGPKPGFDQIAVSAVAEIPRYQSIAGDLESLEEHNAAVRRVNAMVADLELGMSGEDRPPEETSPAYDRLRIWAWAEAIADRLMLAVRPSNPESFDARAVHQMFVEAAYRMLRDDERWRREGWAELPDLAFELRRAYYLIKLIGMAQDPVDGDDGGDGDGSGRLDSARIELWRAFELITDSLWEGLASTPAPLGQDQTSDEAGHQAFALAEERLPPALAGFEETRAEAAEIVAAAVEGVSIWLLHPEPAEAQPPAFEVALDRVFEGFPYRDELLLPIEAGGGLRHRDLVKHAQISPAAATSTDIPAAKKLAGDTAGHFGGFLNEDWRKNDLLWGRIDAAEILVGAIMESPAKGASVLEAIHREILEEEGHEAPEGDPYAYLYGNEIGEARMADLPAEQIAGLKARAAFVLRGMLRKAAKDVEADPAVPEKNIRRRVLIAVDGGLRSAGRFAFIYVRKLKERARGSEPRA